MISECKCTVNKILGTNIQGQKTNKQTNPNKTMSRHHCEIFNPSKIFTLEKKPVLNIQVNLEVYTNVVRISDIPHNQSWYIDKIHINIK